MKNRPLVFQLWLVMAAVAALLGLVLLLLFPRLLDDFFTDELFSTIESAQAERMPYIMDQIRDQLIAQELGLEPQAEMFVPEATASNIRTIHHVIVQSDGYIRSPLVLSEPLQEMLNEGVAQFVADGNSRFSYPYQGKTLYLSILYDQAFQDNMYLVSYMTNDYRDQLIDTLFMRLLWLVLAGLLVAWIPAFFLARFLTRPLVRLREHVQKYAERALDEPVSVERADEIGQLATSIEQMRVQLKEHDEAQQSVLQNVSHELKTPVMVIQGYAQSIQDGMIPADRLHHAMAQVETEAKRLERRISELLYMTKLDYLAKRKRSSEPVRLHELIEVVAERMRWLKPELDWQFDLSDTMVDLDLDQWQVVLENLLDNQIRHARSSISVSLQHHLANNEIYLEIRNDGPLFVNDEEQTMFEAFRKGTAGKFGLGLVIVRRICELHEARVEAHNEENGVVFRITFRLGS